MLVNEGLSLHSKNKNPVVGNAVPVLAVKLKRARAYFGYISS